jgi:hypothetical protein
MLRQRVSPALRNAFFFIDETLPITTKDNEETHNLFPDGRPNKDNTFLKSWRISSQKHPELRAYNPETLETNIPGTVSNKGRQLPGKYRMLTPFKFLFEKKIELFFFRSAVFKT